MRICTHCCVLGTWVWLCGECVSQCYSDIDTINHGSTAAPTEQPMQTSTNPADWQEQISEVHERYAIAKVVDPLKLRKLFPLSATIASDVDMMTRLPKGTVLLYVRTRLSPSSFPLEVFVPAYRDSLGVDVPPRMLSYRADELKLFCPADSPLAFRG